MTDKQGRPLRVRKTPYILDWEENRREELKELTGKGILPVDHDAKTHEADEEFDDNLHPFLMGAVAAVVTERKSAKAIVDEMIGGAAERLAEGQRLLGSKL
jgi:hypothetical protein